MRKRNIAAAFEQLLFNLRTKLLDRVLLIFNHINVAHAQEAAEHPHIATQHNGYFFRLIIRNFGRHVRARHGDSYAFFINLRGSIWVHHKFIFSGGACCNGFAAKNGDILSQFLHIQRAFHKFFATALAHVAGLRPPAFRAHFTAPLLAVIKIFQRYVSAPAVHTNAALIVAIICDILRDNTTYRTLILPSGFKIVLGLVFDFNAVPAFQVLLWLAHKDKNVLHFFNVVHTWLRDHLLRVAFRHRDIA